MTGYVALLEHVPGLSYGVWFPDFPGCVSGGDTSQKAMRSARKALQLHIKGMLADRDPIPDPTPVERIVADSSGAGQIPFLVEISTEPPRQVRLNVSLDERLVKEIDAKAEKQGKTRSAFLADAARNALKKSS